MHEGSNLLEHKTGYSHEIHSVDVRKDTLIWNIIINLWRMQSILFIAGNVLCVFMYSYIFVFDAMYFI